MSNLNEDILANIDIVDIVSRYVNLKKIGSNYSGLCPFHREKTPSFVVAQDKQIFKCFGCGLGGNAIKFIMEIEKVDYWDSVKILAKDANIDIAKYQTQNFVGSNSSGEKEKFKLINKKAQEFFQKSLLSSDLAYNYLKNQRKLSDKIINQYGIGFAPNDLSGLVNFLKQKGFEENDLIKTGLAKKSASGQLYNFFKNRIIFPVKDHLGNIVAFAGRSMNAQDMPKYLNSPESVIYDKSNVLYGLDNIKSHIKEYNLVVVLEGYMDVIGLARAGIGVGVATCGTALTHGHIKHLKRFTDKIVLGFDNDEAGFQATIRALKLYYQYDIFPSILLLPSKFKDIDEYVNHLIDNNQLQQLQNFFQNIDTNLDLKIVDGLDYVYDKFSTSYDIKSAIDRKKIINEIFEIIKSISDVSLQMLFVEKLGHKLKINFDVLRGQYGVYVRGKERFTQKISTKKDKHSEEKYRLGSLFYKNYFIDKFKPESRLGSYYDFLKDLLNYFDLDLEKKIINNQLDTDDIQQILQAQLVWEKELEAISQEKLNQIFLGFFTTQIQKYMQLFNKLSIDSSVKGKIFQRFHNLQK